VPQKRVSFALSSAPSRRDVFHSLSQVCVTGFIVRPDVASAAASTIPSSEELARLPLGHARVQYLLDHWDAITSVCGTAVMSDVERKQVIRTEGGAGGNLCTKTPLRVQEFMGYKSITDPLYKVDKLLIRAGPLVDPSDFEDYLDAVEQYRTTADATALLAYTSSWGEANPYVSRFLQSLRLTSFLPHVIFCSHTTATEAKK
jgi:hypothetical protein